MTRLQTMRRIVLPQAMRVIIPPTGNETISMLKTTSLVERDRRAGAALLGAADLLGELQDDPAADRREHLVPDRARPCSRSGSTTSSATTAAAPRGRCRRPPLQRLRRNLVLDRARDGGVDERADGQGRGRPQALRAARGAEGHHASRSRPGEVMCMLGPSGSGKSTFLRCINHLEKINAGRLSVDGELVGYRQSGDKLYELRESEVCRKRARDRDGLPALQPLPAHDRARERRSRRRSA